MTVGSLILVYTTDASKARKVGKQVCDEFSTTQHCNKVRITNASDARAKTQV